MPRALKPPALLATLLLAVVLFEPAGKGLLSLGALYRPIAGITPVELMFIALLAGVSVHLTATRRLRLPEPFTLPLILLALAVLAGIVTGHFDGATNGRIGSSVRVLLYLLLLPFVVVNVIDSREAIRKVIVIAAALAGFKAIVGLAGVALGIGVGEAGTAGGTEGGQTITYYEPLANWLMLVVALAVLAALLLRIPLRRWAKWVAPLAFAALLLSYRRSFWVAFVLGAVLVALVAIGPSGRRLALPAAVFVSLAVWVTLAAGVVTEVQGSGQREGSPIVGRLESLQPSRIASNRADRYRLDERRNVLAEIRDHPLTGLGIGVPWAARYPLPIEYRRGRNYTHVLVLWYWLKLGLLGVIAYVWLLAGAIATAYRLWRIESDALLRVAGLAVFAGLLGLVVVETTASFTGVEPRFTILISTTLGLLASARALGRSDAAPSPA